MFNNIVSALFGLLLIISSSVSVSAHCQMPCGIYDDELRIREINEDIATIVKSMDQILHLEQESPINYNQLVRWIVTKENHADKIQEIVAQYFMAQRIAAGDKDYYEKLGLLHQLLVYSMKCKQTIDLENTTKLKELVNKFETLYFSKSD